MYYWLKNKNNKQVAIFPSCHTGRTLECEAANVRYFLAVVWELASESHIAPTPLLLSEVLDQVHRAATFSSVKVCTTFTLVCFTLTLQNQKEF